MIEPMLALSDVAATLGLVGVFFVLFPVLVNVLVVLAVGQALGERAENQRYRKHGHNPQP
jgi:CBS-domain-containing membrane protein